MSVTCIRKAAWVVAWDAHRQQHYLPSRHRRRLRRQADRASRSGLCRPSDREIDGQGFCVMPGMVNVHTHLQSESIGRGLIEELGNQALYHDRNPRREVGVRDLRPHRGGGRRGRPAPGQPGLDPECDRRAAQERLHHGRPIWRSPGTAGSTRSPTPASAPWPRRCTATRAGSCRPATASTTSGIPRRAGVISRRRCRRPTQRCSHPSGRLSAMVAPMQVDTCTPELIRDSHRRRARAGHQDHRALRAAHPGVQEMVRRHGVTPVQWMHQEGLLGPDMLLGHAIFLDHHSLVQWWTQARSRSPGRDRHLGGALPRRVLALRPDDGGCRQLHPQGRQRGDGHRHRAAEHGGGGPHGLDAGPRGRRQRPRRLAVGAVPCRHHRRGERARPRGHRPPRGRRQGRSRAARPRGAGHAAGARSAAQLLLLCRRPRRAARVRRRTSRW